MDWLFQAFDAETRSRSPFTGNVLTTVAFLYGLSCDDLSLKRSSRRTTRIFPTVVSLRAVQGCGVRCRERRCIEVEDVSKSFLIPSVRRQTDARAPLRRA